MIISLIQLCALLVLAVNGFIVISLVRRLQMRVADLEARAK